MIYEISNILSTLPYHMVFPIETRRLQNFLHKLGIIIITYNGRPTNGWNLDI